MIRRFARGLQMQERRLFFSSLLAGKNFSPASDPLSQKVRSTRAEAGTSLGHPFVVLLRYYYQGSIASARTLGVSNSHAHELAN